MTPPPLTPRILLFVLLALWGLLLLTSLIGLVNLGQFNIVIAVAIAVLMALLVAGFYMHALYEGKIVHIIFVGGVVWFLIMETLTLGDFMTRGWLPFPGK
jgi:cytochrome c oxidase subunit IV